MLCLMALGLNIAVLIGFNGDIYVLKVFFIPRVKYMSERK